MRALTLSLLPSPGWDEGWAVGMQPPALSVFFLQRPDVGGQGWPRKGTLQVSFPLHRWEGGGRGLQVSILSPTLGDQGRCRVSNSWLCFCAVGKSQDDH